MNHKHFVVSTINLLVCRS